MSMTDRTLQTKVLSALETRRGGYQRTLAAVGSGDWVALDWCKPAGSKRRTAHPAPINFIA